MTENKFDKMMHSYCNRETEQFKFKEKKNTTIKYTSVLAASLVFAILLSVLLIPTGGNYANSFVLSVSARGISEEASYHAVSTNKVYETIGDEVVYNGPSLKVRGENIEKVRAYSVEGFVNLSCSARDFNVTDKRFFEKYPPAPDVPDPLFVSIYKENEQGEFEEVVIDPEEFIEPDLDKVIDYNCLEIVDENKHPEEKLIYIGCHPRNENLKELLPEEFSEKYNDTIIIEVTYLDGEIETQQASISYENNEIVFEITT